MLSYMLSEGEGPLYERLYRAIREDILSGRIKEGTRLPSRRSFARNLGISTITVEHAYVQLEAEGYITAEPRKGYYVEKIVQGNRKSEDQRTQIEETAHSPISERRTELFADLTGTEVGAEDFPFSVWSRLMRELLSENQSALLIRAPWNGVSALRQAIAEHLRSFRGMNVDPERIVIGAGTDHLYGLIVQLLGPDRVYAVEDPGYLKIADVYRSLRAECRHIPIGENGLDPACLDDAKANVVHVSPAHHFPTGRVMPAGARHELLAWANASEDRFIIEDEYDSEFRLNGKPIPTLWSEDVCGRVIYMNTFTKTLASTIRISYMVLPPRALERYRKSLSFYSCAVSNFEQYTLARFIERGYFEKHINRMRKSSRIRRNELLKCIADSCLSERSKIMEEDAGLHFLMQLKTEMTDEAFCAAALAEGIRIDPLSRFFSDPKSAPKHVFIVNYATLRTERIPEMVRKLNEIAK